MKVESFVSILGADFFTGVPDSGLKELCNYLMSNFGMDAKHHVIAANEGNSVALGAGYYLATGKVPVVYMQNSGEGNIINPIASLLNEKVYAIPMIFVIGWRGEPGVHDEPQHIYQGEVTIKLLDDMGITSFVIEKDTLEEEIQEAMKRFQAFFEQGKQVAFVVKKGAFSTDAKVKYHNDYEMTREEIIRHIVKVSGEDPILSTTGKASRELFEIREELGQGHRYDFLTVGSMGHSSSIAMGVAYQKPASKVWCIDGDGAVLMHMGAMAVMAQYKPKNLVHVVINNGAHETVGGMPTVASGIDLVDVAEACGYPWAVCAKSVEELDDALNTAKSKDELCFIEVKCAIGARSDLGRPTTSPIENRNGFMEYLKEVYTSLPNRQ